MPTHVINEQKQPMLRIYVTKLFGQRGRNPKAKILPIKKAIGFGMWEQLLDNLDKVFDYNTTDVHTLEIDNLIRSAAKAIDPNTENDFPEYIEPNFAREPLPEPEQDDDDSFTTLTAEDEEQPIDTTTAAATTAAEYTPKYQYPPAPEQAASSSPPAPPKPAPGMPGAQPAPAKSTIVRVKQPNGTIIEMNPTEALEHALHMDGTIPGYSY